MFLLTSISLLALVSGYIGVRLLPALALDAPQRAAGVLLVCLPLLLSPATIFARRMRRRWLARAWAWAGSLALGWVSFLLLLTVLREPVVLLGALAWPAGAASLREGSAQGVVLLAALAVLLGLFMVLRVPRVVEILIPLPDLPADLEGFTIVQISDLHVSYTLRRRYVERVVRRVNALAADLVAITGDLVDGSVADLASEVAPLSQLLSRHGTWFVTGNHEYYSGASAWIAQLRRLGMHVLLNEHAVIRHGTAAFVLAGVTDTQAEAFEAGQRSDPQAALHGAPPQVRPRILLAHRPRSAQAAAAAGYDLQLSGHTHGGQFWPWNLVVRYREPLALGLDRWQGLWVYTSRGTGYWGPPQRLGVPAEITRLRLTRQGRAESGAQ
ncbi:MAG TPA: metallophosphoesterase [Steroidobacteraceae bacterium]|nr:metallophosphoesterase [Steroidobacteraceae bacterium]